MATYASDGTLDTPITGVRALYNAATHGDTITIPASATPYTWATGPLVIKKGVTITVAGSGHKPNDVQIQGDGALAIFIIDGGPDDTASYWTASGTWPRISNMTLQFGDTSPDPKNGFINFVGHCMEFRFDHCDFRAFPHSGAHRGIGITRVESDFWGWGLFDHNHFSNTITSDSIQTDQPAWRPVLSNGQPNPSAPNIPVRSKGDGAWADGPHWAEGLAFRFEDNIFEDEPASIVGVSRGSCRREVRFNLFIDSTTGAHGAETNHPGGRHTEYYNNSFWSPYTTTGAFNSRAGVSVMFNNIIRGRLAIDRVSNYRGWLYGECFGTPTGTNLWDKNKKGNFTDVYGNEYRIDVTLSSVDPNPLYGDIYWTNTYAGANLTNTASPITIDLTSKGLTNNGNPGGGQRWRGFVLRNKSLSVRNVNSRSSGQPVVYPQEAIQVDSSTDTSLSIIKSSKPTLGMEILNGDILELRCIDRYIHQPGAGRGDVLDTKANPAIDDSVPTPRTATNQSWNITQSKRAYPDIDIEGMWFWSNRGSTNGTTGIDTMTSADQICYDIALDPHPNVNCADNPQCFLLDRDVFISGKGSTPAAPAAKSRPPLNIANIASTDPNLRYPINNLITLPDDRLRIGPDQEVYDTFDYLGITNRTFFPTTQNILDGNIATKYYGRAYPDYLIAAAPPTGPIISLSGNMNFGNISVGSSSGVHALLVHNDGDSTLTVSSVSYPTAFSGATGGFSIAAGAAAHSIDVTFTPASATSYTGDITVTSNASSGTNTIAVTGTGVTAAVTLVGGKRSSLVARRE